jgi:hypothetical protein
MRKKAASIPHYIPMLQHQAMPLSIETVEYWYNVLGILGSIPAYRGFSATPAERTSTPSDPW